MSIDTTIWLMVAGPFLVGAIIGGTIGYVVRAERASRELWDADRREAEMLRELAQLSGPRRHPPGRHRRKPQPHRRTSVLPAPS